MHPARLIRPSVFLLTSVVVGATAVWAAPAPIGAGDWREGYERTGFRTRSSALPRTPGIALDLAARARSVPLGLPPLQASVLPLDPAALDLGRTLFFDRRLSVNGTLSCGMCHVPEQGFTQNELRTPVGLEGRSGRRNAPALYNVAYRPALFRDGRETALEGQIWSPLLAANEMGNSDRDAVLTRVGGLDDYAERFARIYPAGLTAGTLGHALASYQRGLLSGGSRFDRWYFGAATDALDDREQRGFEVFRQAGCAACHRLGPAAARFTDDDFHNTGVRHRARSTPRQPQRLQIAPGVFTDLTVSVALPPVDDDGRFEVTGDPVDRDRYRTPSLRNVAVTAPYMHDGSLSTLGDVVAYYDAGGAGAPDQDPRVRPLNLAAEDRAALVAFLESLTGSDVAALASDARSVAVGDPR